jgi:hypothetical protein
VPASLIPSTSWTRPLKAGPEVAPHSYICHPSGRVECRHWSAERPANNVSRWAWGSHQRQDRHRSPAVTRRALYQHFPLCLSAIGSSQQGQFFRGAY